MILAFPDFGIWWLAWFALVPLLWAIERQSTSIAACFFLGWIWGTTFFMGTCWWLTYAPIHYAAFPAWLAYLLILIACIGAGVFPAIFGGLLSILIHRFGSWALLAAPFVWVATEFARYWCTGNDWNALAYSQDSLWILPARLGGALLVSFEVAVWSAFFYYAVWKWKSVGRGKVMIAGVAIMGPLIWYMVSIPSDGNGAKTGQVVAVQPNVPMSGLDQTKWTQLRQRQIEMAETELRKLSENRKPTTVVLPESPMNFMYKDDPEFQRFIGDFARRNNVSVLFNSAEPDKGTTKYFNSAVMVGPDGKEVAEYDKIYLLPFGEAVPPPLDGIMPGFVGNFAYGRNYDLLPVGDAKAGVMICFESHFGQLSRRYVQNGADVIIEMTNDGYLGPTPVLRQHLANAVFRAVETNRPVLRVTNVGITAYITESGAVLDATQPYQEDTRVWSVSKSDGAQTFYVKYGDWFAWLCVAVTLVMVGMSLRRRSVPPAIVGNDQGGDEVAEARA